MAGEEVERGLTDGTLERGVTLRYARGVGNPPTQATLLLPEDVDAVHPPAQGRAVVGRLVVGEVSVATVAQVRWSAPVVGVA